MFHKHITTHSIKLCIHLKTKMGIYVMIHTDQYYIISNCHEVFFKIIENIAEQVLGVEDSRVNPKQRFSLSVLYRDK